ncbi:MAG TPA: nitrilase-related carbon-nitrogen hydrolase, partial [Pseudolabrys sp.]|nr:nitrilase-related carbon-nitrogen hydrolase [Pseudolabrys sp.]
MVAAIFKAAMIQMRSGLTPAGNIDAAAKLIGDAKAAGADYVQTPEMTNIMEVKRERLFATIVEEDADTSLATFRELARKLGLYIHVGSLAIKVAPDKAANRGFLIDPQGRITARYDKI